MAQRTIHMLFGTLLSDKIELFDKNRFLFGSILPDAYINPANRKVAHFIKYISAENCLYFDFQDFFKRFQDKIINDDLYLGYYAHLVEDAFYRYFLYYEKRFMEKIKSYELDILHNDYHILNSYIVRKYALPSYLELPKTFEQESLNEITEFDIPKIIDDYKNDIVELSNEKTVLLTESMLEEFVAKYIGVLADELRSIRNGYSNLNVLDYKWENKK
ncbi:MAG: hypothetical protein E7261_10185 [Lachnospiraceae bacterium]|nr:hypothetical protein [Lachnospiraceae bacterium]